MNQLVVILIIAHKSILTENEIASLKQCYEVLGHYPIKLICPENLNISEYKKANPKIQFEFIDPKWQSNYEMFNRLKMNVLLYKKFKNYQYILFYELEYWCNKGYDYIGAPWFEGWDNAERNSEIIGVGNGGFSLRKIQKTLKISKRIQRIKSLRVFWFRTKIQSIWRYNKMLTSFNFYFKIQSFVDLNTLLFFKSPIQEDHYWTQVVGKVFADYKVASVEDGLKFSFEANPEFLYRKNNKQLPFGCHAWEKYNPEFWKDFILNSVLA